MYLKGTEHVTYGLVDSFHYFISLWVSSSYQTFCYVVISLYHFREFYHEFRTSVQYYFHRPGVLVKPHLLNDVINDVSTFGFNFCHLEPPGSWINHGHTP
eukprot:7805514-Ditylum_brightwellii.AAC.1